MTTDGLTLKAVVSESWTEGVLLRSYGLLNAYAEFVPAIDGSDSPPAVMVGVRPELPGTVEVDGLPIVSWSLVDLTDILYGTLRLVRALDRALDETARRLADERENPA